VNFRPVLFPVSTLSIRTLAQLGKFLTDGLRFDWGNIDGPKFDPEQLAEMKKTCQQHCFSTLNHSLAYCYDDARVIKFIWTQIVKNRLKGGARSFED